MTSEEVVLAYIERIKEVNPIINAVVEDRFEAAIEDARRADRLVQITSEFQLITNYPILGIPFTVKESCSLKGKCFAIIYHSFHPNDLWQWFLTHLRHTIDRFTRKRKLIIHSQRTPFR